ncbi:hypothetical protein H7I40_11120 [Mycolicibacterium madagascariense]|nr:hypothetical protein [Mycolicibacterium madagascariense]
MDPPTTRTPRVDPARPATPPRTPAKARATSSRGSSANGNREIESWLGDLRSGATTPNGPTEAGRPTVARRQAPPAAPAAEPPTTAIPTQRAEPDQTEKIDTRGEADEPKRRGGGVSAADLLRREGRL